MKQSHQRQRNKWKDKAKTITVDEWVVSLTRFGCAMDTVSRRIGTPCKALTGMDPKEYRKKTGLFLAGRDAGIIMARLIEQRTVNGEVIILSADKGRTPSCQTTVRDIYHQFVCVAMINRPIHEQAEYYSGFARGLRDHQVLRNRGRDLKGIEYFHEAVLNHWKVRPKNMRDVGDVWRWIVKVEPTIVDHCSVGAVRKSFLRARLRFASKGRPPKRK